MCYSLRLTLFFFRVLLFIIRFFMSVIQSSMATGLPLHAERTLARASSVV